ncbi:MAG: hypothetical protein P1P63_01330 [Treponemataceae bacterium]
MKTTINETSRKKCLALIHMQKAKAALTDDEYLSILLDHAGVDSASKIENIKQFKTVINVLNKILISKGLEPLGNQGNYNPKELQFLNAVRAKANTVLGFRNGKRLSGFLKKIGKEKLEDCSFRELRRVMGFLSTIERTGR